MHNPRKTIRLSLAALLLLAVWAVSASARPPAPGEAWQGRVIKVFDGDSMILSRDGRRIEVRLWGVDCPEKGQPWAGRARAVTSELLGRTVTVRPVAVDKYGRVVGRLHDPGRGDHGLRLIQNGLAWWFRRFAPDERAYRDAERKARVARRGLWHDANPIPPWKWRASSAPRP